jgi:hypothetical protein
VWLSTFCSDLAGIAAAAETTRPLTDETTPVADYRASWFVYYSDLSSQLVDVADRQAALVPPSVPGGVDIDAAYGRYVTALVDITTNGALLIAVTPDDPVEITLLIQQIEGELVGAADEIDTVESPELVAAAASVPACSGVM